MTTRRAASRRRNVVAIRLVGHALRGVPGNRRSTIQRDSGGTPRGAFPTGTRRDGYSLVEAVVAISISSVLASVAFGLLGILMGVDRGGRRHLHETNSLARLAEQFRADVAMAEDVAPGERRGLHLTFGEGRVVDYASEGGQATREEFVGEDRRQREQFSLPEQAKLVFEIASGQAPAMASMSLVPTGDSASAGPASVRRGWRVEALTGRDRRSARQATNAARKQAQPAEAKP